MQQMENTATSHTNSKSESPTFEEVTEAIEKLKNNKTPGVDCLPGEFFKAGTAMLKEQIHLLIRKYGKVSQCSQNPLWVTELAKKKKKTNKFQDTSRI